MHQEVEGNPNQLMEGIKEGKAWINNPVHRRKTPDGSHCWSIATLTTEPQCKARFQESSNGGLVVKGLNNTTPLLER